MSEHSGDLGDTPERMRTLAQGLDRVLNGKDVKGADRKVGFVLLVFNMNDGAREGQCNYISNADRADIAVMLKEMIARWEGQPKQTGHA
jgi:hypothetical protein